MALTQGPVKSILHSLKTIKIYILLQAKKNHVMGKYSKQARRTVLLSACDVTADRLLIYAF
jgi:hypothetical protein